MCLTCCCEDQPPYVINSMSTHTTSCDSGALNGTFVQHQTVPVIGTSTIISSQPAYGGGISSSIGVSDPFPSYGGGVSTSIGASDSYPAYGSGVSTSINANNSFPSYGDGVSSSIGAVETLPSMSHTTTVYPSDGGINTSTVTFDS